VPAARCDAATAERAAAVPRILVAIPHFFRDEPFAGHGSHGGSRRLRVEAVSACLAGLRATLGRSQATIEIRTRTA
jgi:hypothetical protein